MGKKESGGEAEARKEKGRRNSSLCGGAEGDCRRCGAARHRDVMTNARPVNDHVGIQQLQ